MVSHLAVSKTYKLFIGGAFPRSESGRTYQARDNKGDFMANAALGSRKDLRDAVVAARKGYTAWSKATAYNRGQVIYRIAEMLEGRRTEFVELIATWVPAPQPRSPALMWILRSIGWCITRAGQTSWRLCCAPIRCRAPLLLLAPEPTGVVGILCAIRSPLLGLISVIAPVITGGNALRGDRRRARSLRGNHRRRGHRNPRTYRQE